MKQGSYFMRRDLLVAAVFAATAQFSFSHGVSKGDLVLDHPYATPSLSGVKNGSAYLRGIRNKGEKSDRLLSASSPVAERVELHRMTLDKGVMRMREVPAIDLPPQSTTSLRHGGDYHLMLVDLKQPLKDGDRFELTLNFERAGKETVKVWVQTPRATSNTEHQH
ncbi:MAG: copper chaperone PCu(A)C [Burkholderiaceae bacterium]